LVGSLLAAKIVGSRDLPWLVLRLSHCCPFPCRLATISSKPADAGLPDRALGRAADDDGRFAFATCYTLYILIALVVEERDLVALHGES
jgi:hypothetical protein